MNALVYREPGVLALEKRPSLEAAPGEALIDIHYAGICGTDIAIVGGKHPRAKPPLVPGHEFSGIVRTIPENAAGIKPGDRVVPYPLICCGKCHACRTGNAHVCRVLRLLGIDRDGGMAQVASVPVDMLYRFPESLPFDIASLIEPVAVCVHAIRESRLKYRDTVMITGAGPIGLLTGLLLKDAGAENLFVAEIDDFRLSMCAQFGLASIDVKQVDPVAFIREQTDGEGADLLFEVSGAAEAARQMTELVRGRGQIVMLSVHKDPRAVDLRQLNFKEIDMIGSRVYAREDYALAIGCTVRHHKHLEALISHRLPLTEGAKGLDLIADPKVNTLKVLIDCQA